MPAQHCCQIPYWIATKDAL